MESISISVTLWSRWNKKQKENKETGKMEEIEVLEFNHLECALNLDSAPNPQSQIQTESWKKGKWEKEYARLIDRVVYRGVA